MIELLSTDGVSFAQKSRYLSSLIAKSSERIASVSVLIELTVIFFILKKILREGAIKLVAYSVSHKSKSEVGGMAGIYRAHISVRTAEYR